MVCKSDYLLLVRAVVECFIETGNKILCQDSIIVGQVGCFFLQSSALVLKEDGDWVRKGVRNGCQWSRSYVCVSQVLFLNAKKTFPWSCWWGGRLLNQVLGCTRTFFHYKGNYEARGLVTLPVARYSSIQWSLSSLWLLTAAPVALLSVFSPSVGLRTCPRNLGSVKHSLPLPRCRVMCAPPPFPRRGHRTLS